MLALGGNSYNVLSLWERVSAANIEFSSQSVAW